MLESPKIIDQNLFPHKELLNSIIKWRKIPSNKVIKKFLVRNKIQKISKVMAPLIITAQKDSEQISLKSKKLNQKQQAILKAVNEGAIIPISVINVMQAKIAIDLSDSKPNTQQLKRIDKFIQAAKEAIQSNV